MYIPIRVILVCITLSVLSTVLNVKRWSGKDVRCFYCGNCTSHIYRKYIKGVVDYRWNGRVLTISTDHQDAMPDKIIVRTLLLDGGFDFPATGEIFEQGRLKFVSKL